MKPSLNVNSNLIEFSLENRSIVEFPFSMNRKQNILRFLPEKYLMRNVNLILQKSNKKIRDGIINR